MIVNIVAIVVTMLTIAEVSSYVILYYYVWKQDNQVASRILDQKTIKMRNRINALSVTGLFVTWIMEVSYLVIILSLSFVFKDQDFVREVVTFLRMYEYFFIPLIQIYTSSPIQKFISANR
jgi:hypothetical protein